MRLIYIANWSDHVYDLAKECGLGVEIQDLCIPANLDNPDEIEKKILTQAIQIENLSFHGPFSELVPASRDSEICKVVKYRFESAYEIAYRFHASHLILRTGFIPKTYSPEFWLASTAKFWQEFLLNSPKDMNIHVENVYEEDFALMSELIDMVGDPRLSICLDLGHVNANSSKPMESWIKGLNDRIRYVHMHNNEGIFDDHFGVWKGTIDMIRTLELLRNYSPQADWSIETRAEDIEPSLEWLERRDFLKRREI